MLFVLSELIIITLRTWLNTHFYNEYSTVLRHIHLPFYRDIEFWNWMDLIFLESYQSPSGIWTCSRPPPWVHFSQTVSDVTPPCLSNCHVLEGNVIIVYFWQCISVLLLLLLTSLQYYCWACLLSWYIRSEYFQSSIRSLFSRIIIFIVCIFSFCLLAGGVGHFMAS